MRYYGGGIGHLNNAPPQQADPLDSNSDETDVEENEEDTGSDARDGPQDIVMNNRELEVDETKEEDRSRDDDGDDSDNYDYDESDKGGDEDEDEDDEPSICGSDNEEDDYGYASP